MVPIVAPSRAFTTPSSTISVATTTSVILSPTVMPEVHESDYELTIGAVIGISVGSIALLFVVVLIFCVVANR